MTSTFCLLLTLGLCAGLLGTVPQEQPPVPSGPSILVPSGGETAQPPAPIPPVTDEGTQPNILTLSVGDTEFQLQLQDNPSTQALRKRLPLEIQMQELNGNEKFYRFAEPLPTDSRSLGKIKAGDLLLYQDNCLVLFYEDLRSSYSYTPLGRVIDSSGLAEALGSGSVSLQLSE